MCRHVELDRCNGSIAVVHCPEVGVLGLGFQVLEVTGQPIGSFAHLLHLLHPPAAADAAHHQALQLGHFGEVHVEQDIGGESVLQHVACRMEDCFLVGTEVALPALRPQAVGNGGHLLHASFPCRPHGAAIVNAHRGVVAVVDAAHHEVRHTPQQAVHRQLHAVGGCAAALIYVQAFLLVQELHGNIRYGRYAARGGTARAVGGHYDDVSQLLHHTGQFPDALCLYAIVIRDEYQRSVWHGMYLFMAQR